MKDLVSVIVPVYNVADFLDACVESIIEQSYSNLEIILVDDGSTDNSSRICDSWKKKDDRVTVIHKKNGGLSDARNTGIERAKGKYYVFVDSDDYVDRDFVKELHSAIQRDDVLVAMCGYSRVDNSGREIKRAVLFEKDTVVDGAELLKDTIASDVWDSVVVVWNKMYSKKIFGNSRFENGKLHEDEYFTDKILFGVGPVAVIARSLYYYRKNSDSITGANNNKLEKIRDLLGAFNERTKYYHGKDQELFVITARNYFDNIVRLFVINNDDEKIKEYLKRKMRDFSKNKILEKQLTVKQKIKYCLAKNAPGLLSVLVKRRSMRGCDE